MTEERWQRIHEVFQAALEQPAAARAAYLDEAGAGDPVLRREVESLLEAAVQTGGFDRLAKRFALDEAEALPDRIGPYRVEREIGRGGMGIVYLAVREDDQLSQPVALKVFHAGTHRADLAARFLAEREILARLDHPHIARLLFGGVTEDGMPYFAMEYVEGQPITDHGSSLAINDRLQLFLDVCDAVQHAHRHLIVHRDLKPSNILVTPQGEVKLLDFGIAKLLDDTPVPSTMPLTQTGLRLMTPEYAAPEQIRAEPITTATDVYQLGVLLYELLTGRRPYRLPSRVLHEVARIICEEPPEKPSTAVTHATDSPPQPDEATRNRLRRRLEGDLDTIVLMAMRKEPERRYASVEALADDLHRHLNELPVRARPDTLSYRATKFVRRHRLSVATASIIALLILGFGVAMAIQATRIAQERNRAEEATAFLASVLESFEPAQAHGSLVDTRQFLARAVRRIRTELGTQPLVQATLLDVLGQVYQYRGQYAEADSLLDEALALRLRQLGPRHLDIAQSQFHLAVLLERMGVYERSDSLYQAALATYREQLGPTHPDVIYPLSSRASLLSSRGDYALAETLFREILATYSEPLGDHLDIATSMLDLGRLLVEQQRYTEADSLYREALAMRRRLVGDVHPTVANALDAIGLLALERGDLETAEAVFVEAFDIRQMIFEEGHADLASSFTNLGDVRYRTGAYAEAERLYRDALAIYRRAFGAQHPDAIDAMQQLTATLEAQGQHAAADSLRRASE